MQSRSVRLAVALALASSASAQVTQRVTLGTGGIQGNLICYAPTAVSADGRYFMFDSRATNLVPADLNFWQDVFVRDTVTGTLQRVNVGPGGVEANHRSNGAAMSSDGRFVVFTSEASNLVVGDTNLRWDAFVRDLTLGITQRVSIGPGGAEGDDDSHASSVTPNGRFVAFSSYATNLVAGDTNGYQDVFVRDRQNNTTERVSITSSEAQAAGGDSYNASLSDDGRYVAFASFASNLVPGDTNGVPDIFVRNLAAGTTERVSVGTGGVQGNGECSVLPSISTTGRYVAFGSYASNLVAGDTNATQDVFMRDRQLSTTERVSLGASGEQLQWNSAFGCLSPDGSLVTFANFLNFLPDDSNDLLDGFVRDRTGGPSFTSLCEPGLAGVRPCPCGNPAGGPDRGCNNSQGTGGASLSASGATFVTSDSLVFTTSGQRTSTLSILSQWSAPAPSGAVFGQGVRCATGNLKRLYVKTSSMGSITAPNFQAGDPPITDRSAALGDPIVGGTSRWYIVYYRDGTVLGGCPSASTFNATQTGAVQWAP